MGVGKTGAKSGGRTKILRGTVEKKKENSRGIEIVKKNVTNESEKSD